MEAEKTSTTSTSKTHKSPAIFSGESPENSHTQCKKRMFHQSWLPKEELHLLNDVLKIVQKGSETPSSSSCSSFDHFNGSFRSKFLKEELVGKLNSLKRRYEKHVGKIRDAEEGELIEFQSFHERALFDASLKIWGENGKTNDLGSDEIRKNDLGSDEIRKNDLGSEEIRKNGLGSEEIRECVLRNVGFAENDVENVEEREVGFQFEEEEDLVCDFGKRYPNLVEELSGFSRCDHCFGCDLDRKLMVNNCFSKWVQVFAEGFDCLEEWELEKMDEQWKLQKLREFEVFSKRVGLFQKQRKLIKEAIKASKH